MSVPRNKPCPCNSGKKYKKCCWDPSPKLWTVPETPAEDTTNAEPIAPVRVHSRSHRSVLPLSLLAAAMMGGHR